MVELCHVDDVESLRELRDARADVERERRGGGIRGGVDIDLLGVCIVGDHVIDRFRCRETASIRQERKDGMRGRQDGQVLC